jgi:hypothetical protein
MDEPGRPDTPDAAPAADDPETFTPGGERLLLDAMLGKLATYLRMCGYDAAYVLDRGVEADDAVVELAEQEGRRLLTRDERLAARAPGGVLLTTRDVEDQLRELAGAGFELALGTPSRCSRCNAVLERLPPDATVPDYVPDDASPIWRCTACGQHYWRGTHWEDVRKRLSGL